MAWLPHIWNGTLREHYLTSGADHAALTSGAAP